MTKAVFYHAGCPVCVSAEQQLLGLLSDNVQVEVVHLGERPTRVAEAERLGVQSVPALVVDGQVLHINFGAALVDLKA
ncbi:glutaredoxin domain-containing protein [Serratia marcescens]|uniref:glutaredoxin domain-containing protein n=1 Tax=Serratia TaxID=613 RepID=UPI000745343B|nr:MULTISPECIES: glutaredoxin domain-containing protein [Serratia]MDI6932550.1 glutaredoxin domain-containing protein [Serratia sp. Se-PFBMAAmG]MBH2764366.1 thioredoxin family protein [Serratia marcescens]MBH2797553.1 thioredoxin family protein [Serratia marcescens]MBH3086815.1 thioredoxin family protein [Serratia marcescens]MBH3104647.1 thioredoxin family protein [Serratia marcescens]